MLVTIPNPSFPQGLIEYMSAIAYLRQSALAASIIDGLHASNLRTGVRIVNAGGSEYIPPYDARCQAVHTGGEIVWNASQQVPTYDMGPRNPHRDPNEGTRVRAPWTREQGWGAWVVEWVLGPRSRMGSMSPAVALLHEMGHATQYASDPAGFRNLAADNLIELENINVQAIEATVIHELRAQGHPENARWDYQHGQFAGDHAEEWPARLRGL
jgi:hypothetical protein